MQTISDRITYFQKKVLPAKLLVVTKGRSSAEIQEVLNSGVNMIGENKLQEIQKKYNLPLFHEMKRKGVELAFIGHLQSNKAKKVVRLCDTIHSVDSIALAQEISSSAQAEKKIMPLFLELALTGEPQKCGFQENLLNANFSAITSLPGIQVQGFMVMGKEGDQAVTRAAFRQCKSLAERFGLSEISMGMSDDYEIALKEGATIVRLGRVIFEPSSLA
jgi:pyridoxal phosphate enzyme (YggS family)